MKRTAMRSVAITGTTATALAIYLLTLCPDVWSGDSGELALASAVWGVPHPPGYPLFVLIGHLFVRAGAVFGFEPAVMTNCLSAFCAALAAGVVAAVLMRVGARALIAYSASVYVALSVPVWSSAVVTEVYTGAALITVLLIWAAGRMEWERRDGSAAMLAYLAGAGLVIHQTLLFALPAVAWFLWSTRRDGDGSRSETAPREGARPARKPYGAFALVGAATVGISPFLLLLVRAHADPAINWGDPRTPAGLLTLLLRRNYGELAQSPVSLTLFAAHAQAFFVRLVAVFPIPIAVLGPIGLLWIKGRSPRLAVFTAALFVGLAFGVIAVVRPPADATHIRQISAFDLPAVVVFGLWCGAGFQALAEVVWSRVHVGLTRPQAAAVVTMAAVAMVCVPAWQAARGISSCSRRGAFAARAYGENILRALPRGATLMTDGDNETFIVGYLTLALGERPDVRVVHTKGYLFDAPSALRHAPRARQAALSNRWVSSVAARGDVWSATWIAPSRTGRFRMVRDGLLFRFVGGRQNATEIGAGGRARATLVASDLSVLRWSPRRLDFLARKFVIGYLEALWGWRVGGHPPLDVARDSRAGLLRAMARTGYDFPEAQIFVGYQWERIGRFHRARRCYRRALSLAPGQPLAVAALAHVTRTR